jgi:RNA polymerase sigma factor (sigma-70 family)
VLEALQRLPQKQRRVIELLKLQDLSVKEVAIEVGLSEGAVKVTAFRGYEAMRKLFGVKK